MKKDQAIKIKVKYINEGKNKFYSFPKNSFNYQVFDQKVKDQYRGYCQFIYTFQGPQETIDFASAEIFQQIMQKVKKDWVFLANVIGGNEAINSIRHHLKNKNIKEVIQLDGTDQSLKKEINQAKSDKSEGNKKKSAKQGIQSPKQSKEQLLQFQRVSKNNQSINQSGIVQQSYSNIKNSIFEERQYSGFIGEQSRQNNQNSSNALFYKRIDSLLNRYQSFKSIDQFKMEVIRLINNQVYSEMKKGTMFEDEQKINIAGKTICTECKAVNFRGPIYQCLVCPEKLYFCCVCQAKSELKSHRFRAHPMAKIKYASQFIKQKQVKTIQCKDIQPPNSDEEQEHCFKVEKVHEKKSNLKIQKYSKEMNDKEQKNIKNKDNLEKDIKYKASQKKVSQIQIKAKKKIQQTMNQSEQKVIDQSQQISFNQTFRKSNARKMDMINEERAESKVSSILSTMQIQKKRIRLKTLFNATDEEIQKYMKGEYLNMTYLDIVNQLKSKK